MQAYHKLTQQALMHLHTCITVNSQRSQGSIGILYQLHAPMYPTGAAVAILHRPKPPY